MDLDATIDHIAEYGFDFFAAGPSYRAGYEAAVRHDPTSNLEEVSVPTAIVARSDDVLASHLDHLPAARSGSVEVIRLGPGTEAHQTIVMNLFLAHPGDTLEDLGVIDEDQGFFLADTGQGQLFVRERGKRGSMPLFVLPDPPAGYVSCRKLVEALAAYFNVYIIDLPGLGRSDALNPASATAFVEAFAAVADRVGQLRFAVLGQGLSSLLAASWAQSDTRVSHLVLDGPVWPDECELMQLQTGYNVDLTPEASGAHLHRAWHLLRDRELSSPWYDFSRGAARPRSDTTDATEMHDRLLDILRFGPRALDAANAALALRPTAGQSSTHEVLIPWVQGDPYYRFAERAAEELPGSKAFMLESLERQLPSLLDDHTRQRVQQ